VALHRARPSGVTSERRKPEGSIDEAPKRGVSIRQVRITVTGGGGAIGFHGIALGGEDSTGIDRAPTLSRLLDGGPDEKLSGTAPSFIRTEGTDIIFDRCTIGSDVAIHMDPGRVVALDSWVSGFGSVQWSELAVKLEGDVLSRHWAHLNGSVSVSGEATAAKVATDKAAGRKKKLYEQAKFAERICRTINARRRTSYESRAEDDLGGADYEDAVLESKVPGEATIGLQIRHFHNEIARRLNSRPHSMSQLGLSNISSVLQDAIDEKAKVDSDVRARTHLVLISPIPLGKMLRSLVASHCFESGGFAEIWLAAEGEEPFSLLH